MGCPAGSAIPLVHAQKTGIEELPMMLAEFGGHLLPRNQTTTGELRFSWRMITAMLSLYRAAGNARTPAGCPPTFVHLASERDSPVVQCTMVHKRLEENLGSSFLNVVESPVYDGITPQEIRPLRKVSQWMTLWMPPRRTCCSSLVRRVARADSKMQSPCSPQQAESARVLAR